MNTVKHSGWRFPIGPGDVVYQHLCKTHSKIVQQIEERGLTDRDIQYLRLQRMIAEAKRQRR